MQLDDQLKIRTPEGVELTLTLAGLGSRIVASLLDTLLQVVAVVVVAIAASFAPAGAGDLAFGLVALFVFLLFLGYPILFEVLDGGRSIGKRAAGIKVVRTDGGPIGLASAAIRNVMRLVDLLPFAYAVGAITIVATARNQRLGDLAAGAVVIRERLGKPIPLGQFLSEPEPAGTTRFDLTALAQEDLALISRFFERRGSLSPERRQQLGGEIAQRIANKTAVDVPEDPEPFLWAVLRQSASS